MRVVMFTNTYEPHVGGVSRSVSTLRRELLRRDHGVLVVAPAYEGFEHDDDGILRIPSAGPIGASNYAMPIPLSRHIRDEIRAFDPQIVHSHHPFLLGDTALRTAASLDRPSVYTYHTRYEYYVGGERHRSDRTARLLRALATGYANIADAVIAPSESLAGLLAQDGVQTPVRVIPTGIDVARLRRGNRASMRRRLGIGDDDFVIGHLGRLTAEKNLAFLVEAVSESLAREPRCQAIVSGAGPLSTLVQERIGQASIGSRLHLVDVLDDADLASFYAAMDVFAFASLSETQGLVVSEAMATGTPVVALHAPGVAEAVGVDSGGTLLEAAASTTRFADALLSYAALAPAALADRRAASARAAARFSIDAMGDAVESLYHALLEQPRHGDPEARRAWESAWSGLTTEIDLLENLLHAAGVAVRTATTAPVD